LQVDFLFLFNDLDNLGFGGAYKNVLLAVAHKKLWLIIQSELKCVKYFNLLFIEIKTKNVILLDKNYCVRYPHKILEIILHGHFVENLKFFNDYSFVKDKIIYIFPVEYE
jgi:hypothetical protein